MIKCELCEKPNNPDWKPHIHLSEHTVIYHFIGPAFIMQTPGGIMGFQSDTCIKCGRNLTEPTV